MEDRREWITIEVTNDEGSLRRDADRLRSCYAGRYDFRITRLEPRRGEAFALAVRHRDRV